MDDKDIIATDAGNFRPQGIKNLTPGLVERGKIKIGVKGAAITSRGGNSFQPPKKLDHFLVTTTERGTDGNFTTDTTIMQMLGDKPKEIPIRLVYDDINLNFPSRYAAYVGKTLYCTGDGVQARRALIKDKKPTGQHALVTCPCHRQDPTYTGPDKCKITGVLSAVIDGGNVVGGVWKFRTTSYNSVVGILSSLAMIQRISGGRLAGVPLVLKLSPKSVQDPVNQTQQTIYVVSIEYRGTVQGLQKDGYQALLIDKEHGARIEQLENNARQLMAARDEYETDADDITEEFYPEAAAAAHGVEYEEPAPRAAAISYQAEEVEQAEEDEDEPDEEPAPEKKKAPAKTKKKKPAPEPEPVEAPAPAPAPAPDADEDLF